MSEYLMYLRKSRQDDPNESVEEVLRKHEIILQDYALKNFGYRIPEKDIYREVVSGETIHDRPMIQKMFERMEKENLRGILCKDVSRLTRGDLYDKGVVLNTFLYTSTFVVTPTKTYDLSNKFDRKLFEMELSRGSDYLEYTKEILSGGRIASKKRGNYIHNIPPYGYNRIKIGKDWTLEINETEAQYVRLVFELYLKGYGAWVIANKIEELGAKPRYIEHFNESVIRNMLSNEAYIGKIRIGERTTVKVMENGKIVKKRIRHKDYEVVDGKHEPIISEELFNEVQKRKGTITREKVDNTLKNMWSGIIKCSKCGKAVEMVRFTKDGVDLRKPRMRCKNARNCANKSNHYNEIHEALVNQLKIHLENFSVRFKENNTESVKKHENLLKSLTKQLEEVNKKQETICDYLENGIYTVEVFVARNQKLNEEKEKLDKAIENAKKEIPSIKEANEMLVTFHETLGMLNDDTISAKTKNTFLKKFIDVIYYTKDDNGIVLDIRLKL